MTENTVPRRVGGILSGLSLLLTLALVFGQRRSGKIGREVT